MKKKDSQQYTKHGGGWVDDVWAPGTPSSRLYSRIERKAAMESSIQAQKHLQALQAASCLSDDVVRLGSSVKVNIMGDTEIYEIVKEGHPLENKLSFESPIGKALIGHKVGESVIADAPNGKMKITILDINQESFS